MDPSVNIGNIGKFIKSIGSSNDSSVAISQVPFGIAIDGTDNRIFQG